MFKDNAAERFKGHAYKNGFRYSPVQPQTLFGLLRNKVKDFIASKKEIPKYYSYDEEWADILKAAKRSNSKVLLSGFVCFDDTPRRGMRARIIQGFSLEKFSHYLSELLLISKEQNKEYVFLSAWNEWGEGMYLEPDVNFKYGYLASVKDALLAAGVFREG